ncbi:fatty acyl-AMP ligase [Streptomyces sp. NPDC056049]|uniref:fatty acyl-AMP ligase n=1 Tax=Streptomyces sp. NPDC056049 TaxID=3345693 RepID=UPI0035E2D7B1
MPDIRSFTEAVRDSAARTPDREALVLLGDSADEPRTVSYRELDRHARVLAGRLQESGVRGERVLLLHGDRRRFAVSFLACLYVGAVAVPVPPPRGRAPHEQRIAGIVKDASPVLALTDAAEAPEVSRLLAEHGRGGVVCLSADTVAPAGPWTPPELDGDSVAYLQYTSGSTREPRGVTVTHANLLANQRAIQRALGTVPGDRVGGWLPFHHDMGLVGQLLHPLWLGGTSVLLEPEAFVRHPHRWLRAVSDHGVTVSGAPDSAYELCVRRITDEQLAGLDLSGWRTAVSGGEPVSPDSGRAFAERFAAAGFRAGALTTAYGLAESTLLATAGPRDTAPAPRTLDAAALEADVLSPARAGAPHRTLVSSGRPVDCDIRIVDPELCTELPEGRVGEVWLRGASVARGYWNNPAETARTFDCRTGGEGGFLRTGDLGALSGGELYVTGRLTDVMVVGGRNLYPQDVERTVERISTLFGPATAFAVPGHRERVVVVQELRHRGRYDTDLGALAEAVADCLAEEFQVVAGGVLLVRPGTVRRTTSGKVERSAMRGLFLAGELNPLHERFDPDVAPLPVPGARG